MEETRQGEESGGCAGGGDEGVLVRGRPCTALRAIELSSAALLDVQGLQRGKPFFSPSLSPSAANALFQLRHNGPAVLRKGP